MSEPMKKNLSEQAKDLTIHGVSKVVTTKTKIGKAIWFLLCIVALGFLVNFAARSIHNHLERKTYIDKVVINKESIPLPAITFCNTNIFSSAPTAVGQDLPENCSMIQDRHFKNKVNKDFFKMACRLFFGNISQPSSKIKFYPKHSPSFPRNFSFLPSYSPCFTLNRNSTYQQFNAGQDYGLDMILNFDENQHTENPYDVLADIRKGLEVHVHEPSVHYTKVDGIRISPGYHTQVKIRKVVKHRKSAPFPSDCVKQGKEKYQKIFSGKQTINLCYATCFMLGMYEICGKVFENAKIFMPPAEFPDKSSITESECMEKMLKSYKPRDCKCQLPCYEERYQTLVSHTPWPQSLQSKDYSNMLAENLGVVNTSFSFEEIRKRLIKVSFYYDEIKVEEQFEREMYSLDKIVSDFGGQMGLFLGASVLSIVEIFLLVFNGFAALFRKKRNLGGRQT